MGTASATPLAAYGIRFAVVDGAAEIGRAFLYVLRNDLHAEPFGLLEDLFVSESHRGHGVGATLIEHIIAAAKKERCYKLIATSRSSRPQVHQMYERLGFSRYGLEFRLDLRSVEP